MSARGDPGGIPWVGEEVLRVLKPVEEQDHQPAQVNFNIFRILFSYQRYLHERQSRSKTSGEMGFNRSLSH